MTHHRGEPRSRGGASRRRFFVVTDDQHHRVLCGGVDGGDGGSGGGGLDGGWLQWSEQFEGWQSGQWLGLGAAGCGGGADGLGVGGSWSGSFVLCIELSTGFRIGHTRCCFQLTNTFLFFPDGTLCRRDGVIFAATAEALQRSFAVGAVMWGFAAPLASSRLTAR